MTAADVALHAKVDFAYEVGHAFKDLGLVVSRDLLVGSIGTIPPLFPGGLMQVQVMPEYAETWRHSLLDYPPADSHLDEVGVRHWSCTGRLDMTDTDIRLTWIEAES